MFPKPEKRWSAAEAAACILLVMTFGHLLNTVMNVTGFTRIFSGYQDMASKIYEGQNPLLLILSVGVLSAAAEEIVFRGMIYRRAKRFLGNRLGHRSIMSAVRCISRQCDAVCLCSRGKCASDPYL